ncbi:DUF605-domain-containing protein [Cystobasidium minutum MCA 4210]|uniref:DUF605-domain-containing protein n=1 Tax=Cystobasidium minutum MCA 4210 TaxID=1397322 RepID=UPI0034CD03B2|eukprot:jgi/Rhomi1/53983/CE53982_594
MDPHTPKVCVPFLTRAKELATRDPVMAYWCKFMAAKLALDQLDSLDDDAKAALEGVMDDLEESKSKLSDNELVTDDTAGSAYIYNFASRVFDGADATDRNGKATRATAKEFLAASNFFEILSIFGPLETDVNEKITYAKWKASSIAKAFREGRTPTPGPANAPSPAIVASPPLPSSSQLEDGGEPIQPTHHANDSSEEVSRQLLGGHTSSTQAPDLARGSSIDISQDQEDNDEDMPSRFALPPPPAENPGAPPRSLPSVPDGFSSTSSTHPSAPHDDPSFPTFPAPSTTSTSTAPSRPSANTTAPPAPSAPPAQSYNHHQEIVPEIEDWQPEPSSLDPEVLASAQKHAKWAISALNYEDVETARAELKKALELIGG